MAKTLIDKVQYINTIRRRVVNREEVSADDLRTSIRYVQELQAYNDARRSWIKKFTDRVRATYKLVTDQVLPG